MRKSKLAISIAAMLTLAACSTSTTSGNDDAGEILVGSLHPLTGPLAAEGQLMDNGVKLAVDDINAAGGIKSLGGRKLKVTSADTQGKPEVAQSEAQRIIDSGAVALIGTYQSAATQNVAATAERNRVPLVVDVTVADVLLEQGYRYTFRAQPNATQMGGLSAQYLVELAEQSGQELTSIAYLHEQGEFGTSVKNAFVEKITELGVPVVLEISYDPFGSTDFTTHVSRIRESGANVLVVTGYYNDAVGITRALHAVQPEIDVVYGVAVPFDQPEFIAETQDQSEGFIVSGYRYNELSDKVTDIRERYEAQYGKPMTSAAVLAYEAVLTLADALDRAGSTDGEKLRDALAQTSRDDHLQAFSGPIRFDETGQNQSASPVVLQLTDGVIGQIYPADLASKEPVFPNPPSYRK